MPNVKQIVRQWLETDAAFGVADVPVRTPKKTAPQPARTVAAPAARPVTQVRQEIARTFQQPTQAKPAPSRTPDPGTRNPTFAVRQVDMARTKNVIVMPAAPAGKIADLPALTRRQKEELLETLRQETLGNCAAYINEISTKLVFGEGDADAAIMFVGEGPGIEEDKTGRPFVGRSGQLLDKMIVAMGFKREQVYIANVVKLRCADPDDSNGGRLKDRPPTPEEAARGLPILHRQIEIIRPKVIVTLGAPAIKHLTGTTEGVMKIRGTWFDFRGIPVMPTYHPSFLLRAYTEENRRKVWGDLKMAVARAK